MEHVKQNKRIAAFMGCSTLFNTVTDSTLYEVEQGIFEADELKYHENWNWLIPVIHVIRDTVNIDFYFEEYDDWRESVKQIDPYNYDIKICYEGVIKFLNFYDNIKNENIMYIRHTCTA